MYHFFPKVRFLRPIGLLATFFCCIIPSFELFSFLFQGTTKCKAITACTLIIILYSSRAVYNLFAISQPLNKVISFGFGWINVSDQVFTWNAMKIYAFNFQ